MHILSFFNQEVTWDEIDQAKIYISHIFPLVEYHDPFKGHAWQPVGSDLT